MNKLWRIWGEYFNYPQCCIDHFCNPEVKGYSQYTENHIARGTGFVPCPKCFHKTKNLSKEELIAWMGRDFFKSGNFLVEVTSAKWKKLADKYNFDRNKYIKESI